MAAKLRAGDRVRAIAGRDKGKEGEILRMLRDSDRAVVGGLNQVVRHQKESRGETGGRLTREAPIHVSNLMLLDPGDNKPTRVGIRTEEADGRRRQVRIAKRTGARIDG